MNTEQFDKLSKTISKGKWHYILLHGVIGWGVTTAVLCSFLQTFISDTAFKENIGLSLIVFPFAGIGWGAFMWSLNQKTFNKHKSGE